MYRGEGERKIAEAIDRQTRAAISKIGAGIPSLVNLKYQMEEPLIAMH